MRIEGSIRVKTIANFWIFEVKPPLEKALEIAPEDKLDWAPAPNMFTLGNVFMHIAETSAWWIDHIVDGKEYLELTPSKCPPKAEIARLLEGHWQRLENFFVRSPQILEQVHQKERDGKISRYEGHWIMLHLFEHDVHHRSQINHYLRILGVTPPEI